MISKVKSVTGNGAFENVNGGDLGNGKKGFFKFEYTMEDGTIITANHKTNSSFKVGDDVEYEVKKDDPTYGKSGSVGKPKEGNFSTGGGHTKQPFIPADQDAILYSVCLKEAVNILRPTDTFIEIKPKAINDYAMELAKGAKENIAKLKF